MNSNVYISNFLLRHILSNLWIKYKKKKKNLKSTTQSTHTALEQKAHSGTAQRRSDSRETRVRGGYQWRTDPEIAEARALRRKCAYIWETRRSLACILSCINIDTLWAKEKEREIRTQRKLRVRYIYIYIYTSCTKIRSCGSQKRLVVRCDIQRARAFSSVSARLLHNAAMMIYAVDQICKSPRSIGTPCLRRI